MRKIFRNRLFLAVLFLFSALPWFAACQNAPASQNVPALQSAPAAPAEPVPAQKWEYNSLVLGTPRPGEPFVVAVSGMAPQGAASGRMQAALTRNGKDLSKAQFFDLGAMSSRGPVNAALLAVPSTAAAGKASLRIEAAGKTLETLELTIEGREFRTETIDITGAMSDILTVPDPEKDRQARQLWAILGTTGTEVYSWGNFVMPVVSEVQTSRFGGRRVYKYPDGRTSTSIHAGIDWRAPTGTPISSCGRGRVVMAMNRIVTGNTVIIEHIPGVYSLYYHLSKFTVTVGDLVEPGTPIGEAGATGFATGAHLHWEVRVSGENTDPLAFLNRTILDRDAILGHFNSSVVQ